MRDHGGQITVSSKVQVGTTFSILLPARIVTNGNGAAPILVAHTDQGDRDFVAAAIAAWGYTVAAAGRTDEALTRYRRNDLQMLLVGRSILEGDLDGWRAARADDARRVPLIVMSMPADDGELERFGQSQASAVLAPPYQLRSLRSALAAVLGDKECA